MYMNNKTIFRYAIILLCIIVGYELLNFCFELMTQPDTFVFWAGAVIATAVGFGLANIVGRQIFLISKTKTKTEKNEQS
jgi:hypothetical protein